ncbi:Uncharacterised protein [uncultured archaeon]|nr:Uncharacterised protein [uncultured archaeon]
MPAKKNRGLKEKAKDIWNSSEERLSDVKEKTEDVIKEHPYASIIIAAAVGAIAGAVTSEIINGMRRKKERSVLEKIKGMF